MAKRVRPAATPVGDAYEAAVRYLGGRPHTVAEIHRHLRSKKFDAETIDHAIDRLRAQRYVDDEAFARWWVEQRERFKPRGHRALRTELAQKGVGRDVVDLVLGERAPDAEKRRKIHTYLAARGFDYDTIDEVTRREVTDED